MGYFELLILAISLVFDTFAVSVSGGISLPKSIKLSKKAMIMAFFGFFQAVYLFFGWFVGEKFAHHITQWDHWIAFAILLYLGSKMIYDGVKGEGGSNGTVNLLSMKSLFFLATATSIDAVAVGASLAFVAIGTTKIIFTVLTTFAVTFLASYAGLQGGKRVGDKVGGRASVLGGSILLVIGTKILIEHLMTH